MPTLLGGFVKARLGYQTGQMEGEEMARKQAAEQAAADAQKQRDMMTRALQQKTLDAPGQMDVMAQQHKNALDLETLRSTNDMRAAGARTSASAAKPEKLTEGERRGGALLTMAENAYPVLENAKAPGRLSSIAAKLGANEALSTERQQMEQAASQLVSSYLYLVSGATATDDEIRRRAQEVIPQPGDRPEVVAQKQQARKAMMDAMRVAAGRGADLAAPSSGPDPKAQQRADWDKAAAFLRGKGIDPATKMPPRP
jgi:hypothetical protein